MRRSFRHKISSCLSSKPLLQDVDWISLLTRQTELMGMWLMVRLKPACLGWTATSLCWR